ncbi:MAG TPA: RNA polymerase sigma factor [Longimicrobiales bacterium]|nr:RNA polymerase sigma factor [Longimicrobiales bacterium]
MSMNALMDRGPERTDAELVRASLGEDRDAFSELVRRHQQALYRHARGMGVEHDVALDLVQDAFVRAWVRLRQCRDPEHFRAWLFRLFRNLVLDYTRDIRRRELPLEAAGERASRDEITPFELRASLTQALGELPELLREAFLLRHVAERSYEEIAELTGARLSAVKMRVLRAREQLRATLERGGM